MDVLAVAVAIINLILACWRLYRSLQGLRLIAMSWLLLAYHGLFLIPLTISGKFSTYRNFVGDVLVVSPETIRYLALFVLAFNAVFAVAEVLTWRVSSGKGLRPAAWELRGDPTWLKGAKGILLGCLLGGAILYWFKMEGGGYRSYVEFRGSNWPQVFFWASSPLIVILALQRRYIPALLGCLPFLFFATYLKIRSLVLLSLIPVMVVFYYQFVSQSMLRKKQILKPILVGCALFFFLVGVSIAVTYKKAADVSGIANTPGQITGLPDAGMIYGSSLVFQATLESGQHLGFNGLERYLLNIVNPFVRLFQIQPRALEDPAVYMAWIIDGVPKNSLVFYHYPTLWYADAFLAFGLGGLLLAVLWGVIFSAWEAFMTRNSLIIAVLLPFYIWHCYFLIRGTITGATAPIAYATYISVAIMLLVTPARYLRKDRL